MSEKEKQIDKKEVKEHKGECPEGEHMVDGKCVPIDDGKKSKGDAEKPTIVELKMAQVISERDDAVRKLSEACDTIEDLKKKLANAEDAIMEDVKASIVTEIHPKLSLSQKALSFKSLDELMDIKKVLDVANIPAFKSGTPIYYGDKKSPRQQLADTFTENMKRLKGDKF